jgi:hypothetical protein
MPGQRSPSPRRSSSRARGGELVPGRVEVHAEARGVARERVGEGLLPPRHGAPAERARGVLHPRVGVALHAEPRAARALPRGAVEREQRRGDVRHHPPAARAGEAGGAHEGLAAVHGRRDGASAEAQRELHGVEGAGAGGGAHGDAVHHHVDVVRARGGEGRELVEGHDLAVDAHAHEAVALQPLQRPGEVTRVRAPPRREDHHPRALGEGHDLVDDLGRRARLDGRPAAGARHLADAREEQPEVVVDLGERADRAAGGAPHGALRHRDGRREPVDEVDVGAGRAAQGSARRDAEGFDVAPPPLGEEGVEREGALAAPRGAGDHHQGVAREVEVDVLEVVHTRAAHADRFHRSAGCHAGRRRGIEDPRRRVTVSAATA